MKRVLWCLLTITFAALVESPLAGQKTWTAPRTPDGHPDLQGIWDYRSATPLERPARFAGREFMTPAEVVEYERLAVEREDGRPPDDARTEQSVHPAWWLDYGKTVVKTARTSLIVDPPDGKIPPLSVEGQQRSAARRAAARLRGTADSYESRGLFERCLTRGIPEGLLPGPYNNNLQILQTPGYIVLFTEMIHDARIVPVDGRPHDSPGIGQWLGDSRGHWEGDTLVVDTINFTDKTSFRGAGANLHLIERFTRVDADTLEYRFTVDDPTTWTRPWTVSYPMVKTEGPIYEYACHEGNYGLANILSGARFLEKAAEEASASAVAQGPAARWWSHIVFLADDRMKGRETGSPEHRHAAEYIAQHFKDAGLKPGGTDGYFQRVPFTSRTIVEPKSSLALVRGSTLVPVVLGDEATFSMRITPAPQVEAPMVFAGYGLQVPEAKHDDLAGLDLKGKVVLLLTGGPSSIPGPLLAHYQNTRWSYLKAAGAVGVVSIQNPKGQDIPWDRSKLARFLPSMSIADPALDETTGQLLAVTVNPATAEKFFEGSGHSFKDLLALSNAGQVLPRFTLPSSIRATVVTATESVASDNVVGILPGTDPVLKNEYLVVSAHLDHIGVGTMEGDKIYNGAMDNASGIATLIETAAAAAKKPFKRSVIFLAVTAEEKGLLGSRYYASKPTVAPAAIVADLNTDMFLPLFPLKTLIVQGLEESDLAADLQKAARPLGIEVLSDPEPERNAFVRSDQYSFIRTGVPSVSLKVGFAKGSPEHELVKKWRTERYHAPSDDLSQPIDRKAAEDFNKVYLALLEGVANRATRPAWNGDSFFKRFEKKGQ